VKQSLRKFHQARCYLSVFAREDFSLLSLPVRGLIEYLFCGGNEGVYVCVCVGIGVGVCERVCGNVEEGMCLCL